MSWCGVYNCVRCLCGVLLPCGVYHGGPLCFLLSFVLGGGWDQLGLVVPMGGGCGPYLSGLFHHGGVSDSIYIVCRQCALGTLLRASLFGASSASSAMSLYWLRVCNLTF